MNATFKIIARHIAIGAIVTVGFFWFLGELPYFSDISDRLWIWFTLPVLLTLVIWMTAKSIGKQMIEKKRNKYFVSVLFIFCMWLVLILVTSILEGVNSSIRSGRFEVLDSVVGFVIYRLWVYLGLGIIHALIGGIFMAFDLKNSLKLSTSD